METSIEVLEGSGEWRSLVRRELREQAEEWMLIRADEREPGQVYQELRSYSFFQTARTIFVDDVHLFKQDDLVELREGLLGLAPHTKAILSLDAGKFNHIADTLEGLSFNHRTEPSGKRKTSAQARAAGVKIDAELDALLQETFGGQPLRLRHELEKLALLAADRTAGVADWRAVSAQPGVVDGWRFARAVLARDVKTAAEVLSLWRDEGGGSATAGRDLLGAMAYVLRQMMLYKLELAKGASPKQAARAVPGRFGQADERAAAGWSLSQLGRAMDDLVRLDRNLKSVSIPADTQLLDWCVRTC